MSEIITLYQIGHAIKEDRRNNGCRIYYIANQRITIHGSTKYTYCSTPILSRFSNRFKMYDMLSKFNYIRSDDRLYTIKMRSKMMEAMEDEDPITLGTVAGNMV